MNLGWLLGGGAVLLVVAVREALRWRGRRWRAAGPRGDQRDR